MRLKHSPRLVRFIRGLLLFTSSSSRGVARGILKMRIFKNRFKKNQIFKKIKKKIFLGLCYPQSTRMFKKMSVNMVLPFSHQ